MRNLEDYIVKDTTLKYVHANASLETAGHDQEFIARYVEILMPICICLLTLNFVLCMGVEIYRMCNHDQDYEGEIHQGSRHRSYLRFLSKRVDNKKKRGLEVTELDHKLAKMQAFDEEIGQRRDVDRFGFDIQDPVLNMQARGIDDLRNTEAFNKMEEQFKTIATSNYSRLNHQLANIRHKEKEEGRARANSLGLSPRMSLGSSRGPQSARKHSPHRIQSVSPIKPLKRFSMTQVPTGPLHSKTQQVNKEIVIEQVSSGQSHSGQGVLPSGRLSAMSGIEKIEEREEASLSDSSIDAEKPGYMTSPSFSPDQTMKMNPPDRGQGTIDATPGATPLVSPKRTPESALPVQKQRSAGSSQKGTKLQHQASGHLTATLRINSHQFSHGKTLPINSGRRPSHSRQFNSATLTEAECLQKLRNCVVTPKGSQKNLLNLPGTVSRKQSEVTISSNFDSVSPSVKKKKKKKKKRMASTVSVGFEEEVKSPSPLRITSGD